MSEQSEKSIEKFGSAYLHSLGWLLKRVVVVALSIVIAAAITLAITWPGFATMFVMYGVMPAEIFYAENPLADMPNPLLTFFIPTAVWLLLGGPAVYATVEVMFDD